jgi:formate hydrogenlyase subunit 4
VEGGGAVSAAALARFAVALLLAPLLPGVINRVKARFAGRQGPPLRQLYLDLAKLLRKGAVLSRTTTWVFRAGTLVTFAAVVAALAIVPLAGAPALIAFPGDFLLLAYLLALGRFFTVIGALDTGSAFEGMGGSREVQLAALAEPALLVSLAALARLSGSTSLSAMIAAVSPAVWQVEAAALALAAAAILAVFVTENARVPVDDPTTHLELTMIHEVMVLDHSGPDLALVELGAAAKLSLLGALVVGIAVPIRSGVPWVDGPAFAAGMIGLAVLVGAVESSMARLRLLRIPQLLVGASVLAVLSFVMLSR